MLAFLETHTSPGDHLICALSGGADSVALLRALCHVTEKTAQTVSALHIHHGIRGKEADGDVQFCRDLCDELRVALTIEYLDVPRIAQHSGASLETAAREARYRVFHDYAARHQAYILTAHHAGDQAETVLFRLCRGTGLKGLAGIPERRDAILRPFLTLTRPEILQYLDELGQPYRRDSTNADNKISRNYIRAEIVTRLEQFRPGSTLRISELASRLRSDEDCLDDLARNALASCQAGHERQAISNAHDAIASRMIRILYDQVRVSSDALTFDQTAAILSLIRGGAVHASLSLPGGIRFSVERNCIRFDAASPHLPTPPPQQVGIGMQVLAGRNASLILSEEPISPDRFPDMNIYKLLIQSTLSFDTIISNLYVREKRDGDTYRYGGINRKVKKLFCDAKLSPLERTLRPLLCDANGILWIPGFGVRDSVGAPHTPTQVLYCCYCYRRRTEYDTGNSEDTD